MDPAENPARDVCSECGAEGDDTFVVDGLCAACWLLERSTVVNEETDGRSNP